VREAAAIVRGRPEGEVRVETQKEEDAGAREKKTVTTLGFEVETLGFEVDKP
jgi:hypothetical protein